jgi:hypothetical protein
MDAISSGTLRSHTAHDASWKLNDVMGELVPDGDYTLIIEVSDGTAKSIEVPFKKGHETLMMMPADEPPYTGLSVTYQPEP